MTPFKDADQRRDWHRKYNDAHRSAIRERRAARRARLRRFVTRFCVNAKCSTCGAPGAKPASLCAQVETGVRNGWRPERLMGLLQATTIACEKCATSALADKRRAAYIRKDDETP